MKVNVDYNQSVTFIGMPGTGKSYVSNILSKYYNIPLIELDKNIENKYNLTLPEIINKYGEDNFKDIEKHAILDIDFSKQSIISTGGSVIYCKEGMSYLKNKNNIIIYLETDFETLKERTENFTNRGIVFNNLTPLQLFECRNILYNKYRDYKLNLNNLDDISICNNFNIIKNNYGPSIINTLNC